MSLVFINHPLETFTPTHSGALATIIWECCGVARKRNETPTVITRRADIAAFDWPQTIFLDYPKLPEHGPVYKVLRAERKLTGWRHLRQRVYAQRVAAAIQKNNLSSLPLVLFNDPETVVYLRHRFPDAFILHFFQNQLECAPQFRQKFTQSANVVVGVSDFTSSWIKEYYDLQQPVHTIYNGVDTERFHPATTRHEIPIINFVGRTGIEKAPDLFLRAACLVAEKTTKFGVQLVGSNHWDRFELDEYQKQLQRLSNDLQAAGIEVRATGHVSRTNLPSVFRRAHIHVVPSRWDEPFGLTTLEGMASGLTIVASRTGGTPEVVGDAGFLFERDNVNELADILYTLVSDEKLRTEYSLRSRERALKLTWEQTWDSLKKLV